MLLTHVLEFLSKLELFGTARKKSFHDVSDRAISLFKRWLKILLQLFVSLAHAHSTSKVLQVSIFCHFILFGLEFLHN